MADQRESTHSQVELITDPDERDIAEARNGLLQFDFTLKLIDAVVASTEPLKLRPSVIIEMNRIAIAGITASAGAYRTGSISIRHSKHTPPPPEQVPSLVEDLCDYVNANLSKLPIHLAAYVMWRLNWIHPFPDGNGRTSRVLSYYVLCGALKQRLPGKNTIPDQIAADKFSYYDALDVADSAAATGTVNVSEMEKLLGAKLAAQLVSVLQDATGSLSGSTN